MEAVKSAQEDGVVPGGGTALLKAANRYRIEPITKTDSRCEELYLKLVMLRLPRF